MKVHRICGVKTSIVTAAEIPGRDATDRPLLPSLVNPTAPNFTVRDVPADQGDCSVENMEAVAAVGGTAFMPFQSKATGGAGGRFEKRFPYDPFRRDEFLAHDPKRSNAESTFSLMKAKFRDPVRSRTDAVLRNEVFCQMRCHNLCVLIRSQCAFGMEPVFWDGPPASAADILPLVRPG